MIYPFNDRIPVVHETAFIAPNAVLIGQVEIGENASVWFGSVLRGDINRIQIGKNTNVQDGTVLHVDYDVPCIVGDHVTIGHSAILHACEIKNYVRIGMGAIILDGAVVEEGAQVGAGSVVPPGKRIPAGSLFLGIPAKKLRDHSEKERGDIERNASAYVALSREYRKDYPHP